MRKLLLLCATVAVLFSCSKSDIPAPVEEREQVSVSFDYTFTKGQTMVKSAGDDYNSFYNAKIATKQITPENYNITLTDKSTGTVYEHEGKWGGNDRVQILSGTYKVTGYSRPVTKTIDTLAMVFNEEITVSAQGSSITLNAENDSYFLIFGKEYLSSVKYKSWDGSVAKGIDVQLKDFDNKFFYMFIREFPYPSQNILTLIDINSKTSTIDIQKNSFKKGYYYYFNALSNTFNIPQMTAGN